MCSSIKRHGDSLLLCYLCLLNMAVLSWLPDLSSHSADNSHHTVPAALAQAAPLQAVPGVTFTYSTALTPQLTSLTPARGSTEGGTRLTLTGTFPAAAAGATITIAGLPCGSITQTGTTTLSCTTASSTGGNPSAAKPLGPQQVAVLFPDRGLAASARPGGAAVTYEYVDLWSRSTTWGGGPPPEEGDSVLVPANTTVLLDVSPPRLYALVLEGNLVFDDTATEQLHLQVSIAQQGGSHGGGNNRLYVYAVLMWMGSRSCMQLQHPAVISVVCTNPVRCLP